MKNTTDQDFAGISLGGPLVRDHFWFYGSASRPSVTTTDRLNNLGSLPDEDVVTKEYFGKLTANPTEQHFLTFALRRRDRTDENTNITSTSSPTVGSNDFKNVSLGTFHLDLDALGGQLHGIQIQPRPRRTTAPIRSTTSATGRPSTPGGRTSWGSSPDAGLPRRRRHRSGPDVGGASLAVNNQNFQRDELRATFQSFEAVGLHAPRPAGRRHL